MSLTLREFYINHFTAVKDTLDEYPKDDLKLIFLWNNLMPTMEVSIPYTFSDEQLKMLKEKIQVRIDSIKNDFTDEQILNQKACMIYCGLFHDIGEFETHILKGDYIDIRRRKIGTSVQRILRNKITGQEYDFDLMHKTGESKEL